MRRMSSPGAYSLCSENSIDAPACGFWCMPANAPSTITRARTLIDPRRAMSVGSSASGRDATAAFVSGLPSIPLPLAARCLLGADGVDEPFDQRVRVQAVGLGVKGGEHSFHQHRAPQ